MKRLHFLGACLLALGARAQDPCVTTIRPLLPPVLLPIEAPQDIAMDADGSIWITSFLSSQIMHLSPDLVPMESIETPFAGSGREGLTGIAYFFPHDTLLVVQPELLEIWELQKDGTHTGLTLPLSLPPPVNRVPLPFPKGLAYDPLGNGGLGSLWLVEGVMTAVYELSLQGEILGSICHPQDRDGCPGEGAAAQSGGVDIVRAGGRAPVLEILGGLEGRYQLLKVDLQGNPTGMFLPLDEVGGRPAGLERGKARDPESGELKDVILVTVESSAELHVLETVESEFVSIADLRANIGGGTVELSWKNFGGLEGLEVLREGASIAVLAGDASSFVDLSPPEGVLDYEVVASSGACRSGLSCRAVLGPGEVIGGPVPFDGIFAVDITEDASGLLWVTDAEGTIFAYTKGLELAGSIPSPFQGNDTETTGIAFNPAGDGGQGTLFVYNAATNEVAEINFSGELLTPPFPSGVPSDPEDEAYVPSMLYNPEGALGAGSFFYLDYTTGTAQERDRAGTLIHSCFHPEHLAEVPPEKSSLDAYAWGMSAVPGKGFEVLSLPGGRVRDRGTTRISRVNAATCEFEGQEIPLEGIAEQIEPIILGIHETTHDGRPVAYILYSMPYRSLIMEIDSRPLPVPRLTDIQCRQESDDPTVRLSFRNPGGLEGIEVLRDGVVLGSLEGEASSFEDRGVPEGQRTYSVRGVLGGVAGEPSSCGLQVGVGSVAAREFSFPASWVHQVAHDPVEGVYLAASMSNSRSDFIYRFDASLRFLGKVDSPFKYPYQIAAMTVRDAGGSSETYSIGWLPGASPGTLVEFPVRVADASGRALREFKITPPRPRGNFVTYPSGMAWDRAKDSFWYLERNSATIVNMSPEGKELSRFRHPAPLHQDDIRNYGLAIDADRGAIYLSGSERLDYQVTKLVEVTRSGHATGVEVPLDADIYDRVWGFDLSPEKTRFVVAAAGSGIHDILAFRAFSSLPPVQALECKADLASVALSWQNGGAYDGILVYRGLEVAATLEGTVTSWLDEDVDPRPAFYRVVGQKDGSASAGAICEPCFPRAFIRGDVEENGAINITDAIAILSYLFIGGKKPACLDASDTNDDGIVNITDPISLLMFLFLSGNAPEAPFPQAGLDPTEDGRECCS